VAAGFLFVAVRGNDSDGHAYLPQAISRGAAVAIVDRPQRAAIPQLLVTNSRKAAAVAASAFYDSPASRLRLIAVTGTNGKTTTVNIVRHLAGDSGWKGKAASIGTLGVAVGDSPSAPAASFAGSGSSLLTTPGPVELQQTLRSLVDSGVGTVAMEVSSHSLEQRRVEGLEFEAAVFTNFSRDHMDYHQNMGTYFAAKALLVDMVAERGSAVVNADEPAWSRLPRGPGRLVGFAVDAAADVRAADITYSAMGSSWTLVVGSESFSVSLPLIGAFNVSNALAAAAAVWSLGMPASAIAERLSSVPQVSGRMERLHDEPIVLRDYAHTPDALERALVAVKPFSPAGVTVVFGCGGDRDKGKRAEMGSIAARLADTVIITSDNPRTENPEAILDDIAAGISGKSFERIEDRRAAILRAITLASRSGQLVLLAGKGHETYQVRGTERIHFDEKEIVGEIVSARVGSGVAATGNRAAADSGGHTA
jgi:UDP-N-acetylmuramoyl-L-alanyl-D-glutamate--2,6-diaminopimelate ligase